MELVMRLAGMVARVDWAEVAKTVATVVVVAAVAILVSGVDGIVALLLGQGA